MNLHEYETKHLLSHYQIPIPPYGVASNSKEVVEGVEELDLKEAVIKVQIHAGGRGKAGGVKFAENPNEIVRIAESLIGMKITNQQTGPQGVIAKKVIFYAPVNIKKEYYIAATIDRSHGIPILMGSSEGGMEIEKIAQTSPHRLLKVPIQLNGKVRHYHLFELARFMGWKDELLKKGMNLFENLARAFIENDATLIEINPLVLTHESYLTAVDAKCVIDDSALYRQPALAQWYDPSQSNPQEVMAKEFGLSYVGLEGEIGCLVNGAGLAMATMDIIHYYGGNPVNFLDVGGGATQDEISHGFKIILQDPRVKAIFVNIFGGIMDCAVLALGIVGACRENPLKVPLVVRMEGTNQELGKKILTDSQLPIISVNTLAEGAEKAVQAVREKR